MATTPAPVFMRFREQLDDTYGSTVEQIVGQVNHNFANPTSMTLLSSSLTDDLPEPILGEFQQLISGINRGFTNITSAQLSAPVALTVREQLPEPLGQELEGIVGVINLGLRNLYP